MNYTTSTNGPGDLRAQAQHRSNVALMVRAANRVPCRECADRLVCDHGLDDTGLPYVTRRPR